MATRSLGMIRARPYTFRSSRSRVGMPWVTLCVKVLKRSRPGAERPERRTHAQHGHDRRSRS
ncbi:hypothetical protein CXB35_06925 [Pseudomonas syringae]|nr:hypothetical protein CXB35_06925 [Pseudomonas syringae]